MNGPLLVHADLFVSDMARALAFYVDELGLTLLEDCIVHGELPRFLSEGRCSEMRICLLSASRVGAALELVELLGEGRETGAARGITVHPSFLTQNVEELSARLTHHAIAPENRYFDVDLPRLGRSRLMFLRDPDGHWVELIQPLPAMRPA